MIDPKEKNECSKYLSGGYLQHNVIRSEPALDKDIAQLLGWMNKYADEKKPMDLDKFFTYVAFDITGEVVFSKPFGKCIHYPSEIRGLPRRFAVCKRADETKQDSLKRARTSVARLR